MKLIFTKYQMDAIQQTRSLITKQYLLNICSLNFSAVKMVPSESRVKDATIEVDLFVERIFQPVGQLVFSFTLIIVVLFTLLYLHPAETMIIITSLLALYIVSLKIVQPIMKLSAKERVETLSERIKLLETIFNNIDIWKIYNRLDSLMSSYEIATKKYNQVFAKLIYLPILPRYVLESGTFILICYSLLINDSEALIGFLAIYAIGFYKLLPNMQVFYYSFAQLNTFIADFIKFHKQITEVDELEIQVHLRDIQTVKWSLKDEYRSSIIEYEFNRGERVLLSGPSGSGKSTLLRHIAGLEGNLEVYCPSDFSRSYFDNIFYLSQNPNLIEGSMADNIFMMQDVDEVKLRRVLNLLDLQSVYNKHKDLVLSSGSTQISGGQKQRIALARLFVGPKPKIILLDEPTSAVQANLAMKIMQTVFTEFKESLIIFITHDDDIKNLNSMVVDLYEDRNNPHWS